MEVERPIFNELNLEYERLADLEGQAAESRRALAEELVSIECAGTLALAGTVTSAIGTILALVLLINQPNFNYAMQAVWMIVSLLAMVYSIAWAKSVVKALRLSREPSSGQTTLIFLLSIFLALYHFVQMIWLMIYRETNYLYLLSFREDDAGWREKYGSATFESVWNKDKAIITLLVIISPLLAFFFGYFAYAARSLHSQRYYLTRLALYSSLFGLSYCAWLIIYWAQLCFLYQEAMPGSNFGNHPTYLKYIAILIIFAAIGNAIANLMRKKMTYFTMGMITIALSLLIFGVSTSLAKYTRSGATADVFSNTDCKTTMVSIHEKNLVNFCPVGAKYLPEGNGCNKKDLVQRWEGLNPQEIRYLNPSCCKVAKLYYAQPFEILSYWGLASFFLLAFVCLLNFVLVDYDSNRLWIGRITKLMDICWLAAIAALFLGFLLYFLIRSKAQIEHELNPQVLSYLKPDENRIAGLDLVPQNIKQKYQDNIKERCFGWHDKAFPKITSDDSVCKDDCVHRIAMTVNDGKVLLGYSPGSSTGDPISKPIFFPGCSSSDEQFLFVYGDLNAVDGIIKDTLICSSIAKGPKISIRHTLVPKSSLSGGGLTNEEKERLDSASGSSVGCLNGFSESTQCNGDCSIFFWPSKVQTTDIVKGKFFYITGGEQKTSIPSSVMVEAFRSGNKLDSRFSLFEGGLWTLENIPRIYNYSYILTLKVTDSSGKFITKEVDMLVSPKDSEITELSAGSIRLLTPNGKVCGEPKEDPCPGSMNDVPTFRGTISFTFENELSSQGGFSALYDIRSYVDILKGHRVQGDPFQVVSTISPTGKAYVSNLPYGAYTILVKKPGYERTAAFIDLQEDLKETSPIALQPSMEDNDMSVKATMDSQVDFDLLLEIKSDTDFNCVVSPYNKYCGYAMKENEVSLREGTEVIMIKRLAAATYLTYVAPSPAYSETCKSGLQLDMSNQHFQSWNWTQFKKQRPLSSILISGEVKFKGEDQADADGLPIVHILPNAPVESQEEANKAKLMIARDGVVQEGKPQYIANSNFGGDMEKRGTILLTEKNSETSATESRPMLNSVSESTLTGAKSSAEKSESEDKTQSVTSSVEGDATLTVTKSSSAVENTKSASSISDQTTVDIHDLYKETLVPDPLANNLELTAVEFPLGYPTHLNLESVDFLVSSSRVNEEGVREESENFKLNSSTTIGGLHSEVVVHRITKEEEEGGATSKLVIDQATNHSTLDNGLTLDSSFIVKVSLQPTGDWSSRNFTLEGETKEGIDVIASRSLSRNDLKDSLGQRSYNESDQADIILDEKTKLRLLHRVAQLQPVEDGHLNKSVSCATRATTDHALGVCNEQSTTIWSNGSKAETTKGEHIETFEPEDRQQILKRIQTTLTHLNNTQATSLNLSNSTVISANLREEKIIYSSDSGLLANDSSVKESSSSYFTKDVAGTGFSTEKRGVNVDRLGSEIFAFKSEKLSKFEPGQTRTKLIASRVELTERANMTVLSIGTNQTDGSWKASSNKVEETIKENEFNRKESEDWLAVFSKQVDSGKSLLDNTTKTSSNTTYEAKLGLDELPNTIRTLKVVKNTESRGLSDQALFFSNNTSNSTSNTTFFDGRVQTREESFIIQKSLTQQGVQASKDFRSTREQTCWKSGECQWISRTTNAEDDGEGKTETSRGLESRQPGDTGLIEVNSTYHKTVTPGIVQEIDDMVTKQSSKDDSSKTVRRLSNDSTIKTNDEERSVHLLHEQTRIMGGSNDTALYSQTETISNTTSSFAPVAFTSSAIEQSSLLMNKDGSKKITVKVTEILNPGEGQKLDSRTFDSHFLLTSLIVDEDKPGLLEEFVSRNESSVTTHASGDFSKTEMSHNETSETNKTLNVTKELHKVTKTYQNGSILVILRNVTGTLYRSNGTVITARNNSHTLLDKNGVQQDLSWTYSVTKLIDLDTSILLESQSYPKDLHQDDSETSEESTSSPPTPESSQKTESSDLKLPADYPFEDTLDGNVFSRGRKRILESPGESVDGNYILLNCFTGFGKPSLIQMKQILESKPTIQTCINFLRNERANFTVERLREALKTS